MNNGLHTVIFDLDGTLSNSALLTMAAFRSVLPSFGIAIPEEEAVIRATGYANPEFYQILFPNVEPDTVRRIGDMVEREETLILPAMGERLLFAGCRELLSRLKESGIRLYIASTGDRDHVYSILQATGITSLFDRISCGRPDKVEMLRELTGAGEKSGYIMVGDMVKDSDGARANGILSAGACFGYCRRELTAFDMYLDDPLELLRLIGDEASLSGINDVRNRLGSN